MLQAIDRNDVLIVEILIEAKINLRWGMDKFTKQAVRYGRLQIIEMFQAEHVPLCGPEIYRAMKNKKNGLYSIITTAKKPTYLEF